MLNHRGGLQSCPLFVDPLFELARRSYKGPSIAALEIDVFQQVTQHFMQLGLYSLRSESMIGHLATVMLHIYAQPCSGTSACSIDSVDDLLPRPAARFVPYPTWRVVYRTLVVILPGAGGCCELSTFPSSLITL